ncbi:MAG: nucleotidyltransferase domain-containing protein [Nitrospirota bacterium]
MSEKSRKDYFPSDKILDILKGNKEILKKYKVKKIGLFGSYLHGEQKNRSDIDLIVEFNEMAFDKNFTGYANNFDSLLSFLKKNLKKKKIDLLTNEMLSPYIRPYVLREVRYIEGI